MCHTLQKIKLWLTENIFATNSIFVNYIYFYFLYLQIRAHEKTNNGRIRKILFENKRKRNCELISYTIFCVYAMRNVCSSAKKISEIEEDQARKGHLYTKCFRNNELWRKDKGKAYNLLLFVAFFYVCVCNTRSVCTVESH